MVLKYYAFSVRRKTNHICPRVLFSLKNALEVMEDDREFFKNSLNEFAFGILMPDDKIFWDDATLPHPTIYGIRHKDGSVTFYDKPLIDGLTNFADNTASVAV